MATIQQVMGERVARPSTPAPRGADRTGVMVRRVYPPRFATQVSAALPRKDRGDTMLVQFTMVLRFDDDTMVADMALAREEAKRAFEAAGFEVKGVRISAMPEPKAAPVPTVSP